MAVTLALVSLVADAPYDASTVVAVGRRIVGHRYKAVVPNHDLPLVRLQLERLLVFGNKARTSFERGAHLAGRAPHLFEDGGQRVGHGLVTVRRLLIVSVYGEVDKPLWFNMVSFYTLSYVNSVL